MTGRHARRRGVVLTKKIPAILPKWRAKVNDGHRPQGDKRNGCIGIAAQ